MSRRPLPGTLLAALALASLGACTSPLDPTADSPADEAVLLTSSEAVESVTVNLCGPDPVVHRNGGGSDGTPPPEVRVCLPDGTWVRNFGHGNGH